jgi:DNA-binding response OmpR family regulator
MLISTSKTEDLIEPPHIVVVEDDPYMREVLEIYLKGEGYRVTVTSDGQQMRAVLANDPAQLVLMDLRLPGEDGFTLTRYLREQYKLGIIILTTRNDTVDRVVGLECGADDYVTKPFEERELLARIRSVLRRSGKNAESDIRRQGAGSVSANGRLDEPLLSFHGCALDEDTGRLCLPLGRTVELTGNECSLLAYLARHAGDVQSRETLMAKVLRRVWDPMDRSIDVLITRLRHKIETSSKKPEMIKTVRGKGYVLAGEPETAASYDAA